MTGGGAHQSHSLLYEGGLRELLSGVGAAAANTNRWAATQKPLGCARDLTVADAPLRHNCGDPGALAASSTITNAQLSAGPGIPRRQRAASLHPVLPRCS